MLVSSAVIKTIILIIASEGYQPLEYGLTRKVLEEAGLKVVVASDKSQAFARPSSSHARTCIDPHCTSEAEKQEAYKSVSVDVLLSQVNPELYDGAFIIGGPGAMEFLDNKVTYSIMQKIAQDGKPYGAICIAPRILAHAGLLKGKKATGWNGDKKLATVFKDSALLINKPVVTDGKLITADGPNAAVSFGKAIVAVVNGMQK